MSAVSLCAGTLDVLETLINELSPPDDTVTVTTEEPFRHPHRRKAT